MADYETDAALDAIALVEAVLHLQEDGQSSTAQVGDPEEVTRILAHFTAALLIELHPDPSACLASWRSGVLQMAYGPTPEAT